MRWCICICVLITKTSITRLMQIDIHKKRERENILHDLHTGDFNLPAHDPFFLRFILDIPKGARKKAQKSPVRAFRALNVNQDTHRTPITAATSLLAQGRGEKGVGSVIIYIITSFPGPRFLLEISLPLLYIILNNYGVAPFDALNTVVQYIHVYQARGQILS